MKQFMSLLLALMLSLTPCGTQSEPADTPSPESSNGIAAAALCNALKDREEDTMKQIALSFNGHTYTATLADNSSAQAFAELLKSEGGAMSVHMSEYGGWEKVGALGQTLPSSDTQTTTAPGDFVLYQSNSVVLFYGSNSWSYTRLGRIDDPSGLREALGDGDVEITFRLADDAL